MDWNSRYEMQDTPWDKGVHTPVLDEFLTRHSDKIQGKIAVPGCGLGHDVRWLAARGECQVIGQDIAPLAIAEARHLDPENSANYQVYDFLNPPPSDLGTFDRIWEHTCFCALNPSLRDAYLKTAALLLKRDGLVLGVFFIHPEMDEGEDGPPFKVSIPELETLWRKAGFEIIDSWVPTTGYEGRVGRELAMVLRYSG